MPSGPPPKKPQVSEPNCVFCQIIAGETPAAKVYEDETSIAFLDLLPLFHGHTLLVPKEHHETLVDLPDDLVAPLFGRAKMLAAAVKESMHAEGTFVAMNNKVSQSVPHLHVHIVPRRPKDGLRGFFWPRTRYEDDQEMQQVAARIKESIR